MIIFHLTTDIKDDRRVLLTLPPEVPTGLVNLVVTVEGSPPEDQQLPAELADWVEVETGQNASLQARYPLRGSVVRYEQPTDPVGEGDWEATR
jgi:hypothetical protein